MNTTKRWIEFATNTLKKMWFFWILVLFLWLIVLPSSYFTVDASQSAVKVVLWKVQNNFYTNGLFFKIPFITKIIKYDIRNTKVEIDVFASSKDLQEIKTTVAVNYNLKKEDVGKIYTNLWKKDEVSSNVIEPTIQEVVKSVFAWFNAEDLVKKRNELSDQIKTNLWTKLQEYNINLLDTNIINFKFSDSFDQAIEAKVTAEQEALAEKNRLEKIKFQAQQKIEEAKGEAEKIRISAEAIQKQGWKEYIQLQFIQKWNWELPKVSWQTNGLILNNLFN